MPSPYKAGGAGDEAGDQLLREIVKRDGDGQTDGV